MTCIKVQCVVMHKLWQIIHSKTCRLQISRPSLKCTLPYRPIFDSNGTIVYKLYIMLYLTHLETCDLVLNLIRKMFAKVIEEVVEEQFFHRLLQKSDFFFHLQESPPMIDSLTTGNNMVGVQQIRPRSQERLQSRPSGKLC